MNRSTMRPSAPVAALNSINYHPGDIEMFIHLVNMMHGDPHPANVLRVTDVDPYNVLPWDLPPSMLYFLKSDKSFEREKVFRPAAVGYWHVSQKNFETLTQCPTMAWKITLEFYMGQVPHGDKTDWVMQEYTVDKLLGFSSLCRVFNRYDGSHSEEHLKAGADDADGELLVAQLLSILEHDENICNLQDVSNMSQVVNGNEHRPPTISGGHLQSLPRPHNSAQDPVGGFDFSEGYIEWNDISGGASSSSRSENTFASSMTLDDCFDSDALLRELDTPIIPDTTKEQNADYRFNVSASQGSHQVLIHQPLSGSAPLGTSKRNHTKNSMVCAPMPSVGIGERNNTRPAVSLPEKLHSKKAPKQGSTAYGINRVNQGLPTSQCAVSISVRGDRRAVGATTKPGKKGGWFSCFPFLSSVTTFFSRKGEKSEKKRREQGKKKY